MARERMSSGRSSVPIKGEAKHTVTTESFKPQRKSGMVKGLVLAGLLLLLCHALAVQAHVLSRYNTANSIGKIKNLLQQLEEALAAEEDTESAVDYEDRNLALSQSQGSPGRVDQAAIPNEDSNTDDGLEMQRKHLMDLLLSTKSKNFSGCFGGRLDRIGSSSSLGCNAMKG